MRALVSAATVFLIATMACLGGSSTGPEDVGTHGWIVGESSQGIVTILHTSDGGTWEPQADTLSIPGADLGSVSVIDSNAVWAAGGISEGYGVVLRTLDGGLTWERLGSSSQIPEAIACISALSEDVAWIGGSNNSVYRTMDGGANWEDLSDPALDGHFWQGIYALSSSDVWLCGGTEEDGLIIHSSNGGLDWTVHGDSLLKTFTMITIAAWDQDNVWAVGHGYTVVKTTDGGSSWELAVPDSMQNPYDANGITLLSENDAWVVFDYGAIWRTGDGGASWTVQSVPAEVQGYYLLRISALDSDRAWVSGRSGFGTPEGIILFTTDGGNTWTVQDDVGLPALWGISFEGDYPN